MISHRVQARLVKHEALLAMIDHRRADTGDPSVGITIEKQVLDLELADLEKAMAIQSNVVCPEKQRLLQSLNAATERYSNAVDRLSVMSGDPRFREARRDVETFRSNLTVARTEFLTHKRQHRC
jgi:hypothetical protein